MSDWPTRIYLQVGPEEGDFPTDYSEVTWSTNNVYQTDREYVNAVELTRLTILCATQAAEIERLRAVLSDVEWESTEYAEYDIPLSACAFCKSLKMNGHAKDCKLKAALATPQPPTTQEHAQ